MEGRLGVPSVLENLDALRALAVAMVVSFHYLTAQFAFAAVGWAGVWLFFVLSGFFITRNLLAEAATRPFPDYIARFYRRRALRIFPLYFAYVIGVGLLIWPLVDVTGREPWEALLTFTKNVHDWVWDEHTSFFDHMWSLSVEEQFYLVFPLALYFTPVRRRGLALVAVILVLPMVRSAAASYLARHGYSPQQIEMFSHEFPFMQWDGFAAGALLALNEQRLADLTDRSVECLALVCFAATLAALVMLRYALLPDVDSLWSAIRLASVSHEALEEMWAYTLVIIASTALVALVYRWRVRPNRLLSSVNYIGRISFGIYVFHFPICAYALKVTRDWSRIWFLLSFLAVCIVTVFLAHLSYRCWERPFLLLKDRPIPLPILWRRRS